MSNGTHPTIAQLAERETVEAKQLSLGHWFESGWSETFLFENKVNFQSESFRLKVSVTHGHRKVPEYGILLVESSLSQKKNENIIKCDKVK